MYHDGLRIVTQEPRHGVLCLSCIRGNPNCPSQPSAKTSTGQTMFFGDPLLDNRIGACQFTGRVLGRNADHTVEVQWVLNHQFLRIQEKDRNPAATGSVPYEAMILVGYDDTSERYVGRFSETLGYGTRFGDDIRFVFECPDGPFHTTFRWHPDSRQWTWLMETKNKSGQGSEFANLTLARLPRELSSARHFTLHMKRNAKPAVKKGSPKPRLRNKFPLISEEMKQWSAMLQSEVNSWPDVTFKSMFGFVFFYRRNVVFAALPRTRGFDSPSSVLFKFNPVPPGLRDRTQSDTRMNSSKNPKSKGWFSFELGSAHDLRDALFWLDRAYRAASK